MVSIPVISTRERLRRGECPKSEVSLGYLMRPYLRKGGRKKGRSKANQLGMAVYDSNPSNQRVK